MMTREAAVRTFVRQTYGPRGTWRLHRAAIGWDMLRAPLNLVLAPLLFLTRLLGLLLRKLGAARLGAWLLSRRLLLPTALGARISAKLEGFLNDLDGAGLGVAAGQVARRVAIARLISVRAAVSEITTMLILLSMGLMLFGRATPGVVSLAGPVAGRGAEALAIDAFPLGRFLGRAWYGVFPVNPSVWEMLMAGGVLAVLAALIASFAGLIADPLQLWSGMHRRRLTRFLNRLDEEAGDEGIEREHLAARIGDLTDLALTLFRSFRG